MTAATQSLCETCAYVRDVQSRRGQHYLLCQNEAIADKYPRQPMLACVGYETTNHPATGRNSGPDRRIQRCERPDADPPGTLASAADLAGPCDSRESAARRAGADGRARLRHRRPRSRAARDDRFTPARRSRRRVAPAAPPRRRPRGVGARQRRARTTGQHCAPPREPWSAESRSCPLPRSRPIRVPSGSAR